jgi:hypothetical protein
LDELFQITAFTKGAHCVLKLAQEPKVLSRLPQASKAIRLIPLTII